MEVEGKGDVDKPGPQHTAHNRDDECNDAAARAQGEIRGENEVKRDLDTQRPHVGKPRDETVRDVDLHEEKVGQNLGARDPAQRGQRHHDHAHTDQITRCDAGQAAPIIARPMRATREQKCRQREEDGDEEIEAFQNRGTERRLKRNMRENDPEGRDRPQALELR